MNLYRFKLRDIFSALFQDAVTFFKRKKQVGPKKTYVVLQHYINGDPIREYARTDDPLEAAHMAILAMGDKDPFLKNVTTIEEK